MSEGENGSLEDYLRIALNDSTGGEKFESHGFHEKLNGKKTQDLTPDGNVYNRHAVPSDALVNPAFAALRARALRKGSDNVSEKPKSPMQISGDIFQRQTAK